MAKIDKILGSISPMYGQISGEGIFGQLTKNGMGGIIPQLIYNARQDDKKSKKDATGRASVGMDETTMRRGGKVKKMAKGGSTASKRADGIARKGKTRGKVC